MLLDIFLRDGKNIQVPSFESFTTAHHEWKNHDAEKISSVKLIDNATFTFKGENVVVIAGKDILYLNIQ
ncbi:hypothetical protein [Enterococcus sp. DIV0086]|uniref:hypothetical protein n=1 Tax=Enterococcus sp. DIV0086 TaxID=2774655 RepID=UPI003D2C36E9